tara:strand:+ start:79 stop:927 length:849 start_codon:yes stop_codon:yes gene_type:complete
MEKEMENIGGQAVIEGVMFKSKKDVTIAVRKPNGEIKVKKEKFKSLTEKFPLSLPFVRGIIILIETLVLGIKALNYSTNENLGKEEQLGTFAMVITFVISIGLAIFLFKFLPLLGAQLLPIENTYLFNLVEGVIKLTILVSYIWLISLMPDVKTLYQYHGAEHKVINAYERDDLVNVKKYSRLHPRCGTSFIIFVVFLSILVYILIPMDYTFWVKLGLRLLLLPLIAGIAYELIKLSGKYKKSKFLLALISPGLLLQRLTTKEPRRDQIEVALRAFREIKHN